MRKDLQEWRSQLPAAGRRVFDQGLKRARREGWLSWVRSCQDVWAVSEGCYFDKRAASLRAAFFPGFLRLSKGLTGQAQQPMTLIPWTRDQVVLPLFGWRRANGLRRFRFLYVEVPKKNTKSTLFAGLGLLLLVADGESAPEVLLAAVDRKQAGIMFEEESRMVRQSPTLAKRLEIIRSTKTITFPGVMGSIKVLSADVDSQDGADASCVLIDELHRHKNRKMFDVLRYAGLSRSQPLFGVITTAGVYDPTHVAWEQHEYAEKVISGQLVNTEMLAVIYGAKEGKDNQAGDDWKDPKVWARVNPSMGVSLKMEDMLAHFQEVEHKPYAQNNFKRLRLNMWTQTADLWMPIDAWNGCRREFTLESLRGRRCYGGIDLSSTQDLSAWALCFPPLVKRPREIGHGESAERQFGEENTEGEGTGIFTEGNEGNEGGGEEGISGYGVAPLEECYLLVFWYWLPRENLAVRAEKNQVPYDAWARDGYLMLSPGDVIDYRTIRRFIGETVGRYGFQVAEIAFDPYRATEIVQDLADDGFTMVQHRQGTLSMNPPMDEWERMLPRREIVHLGDPVTGWMFGNVAVAQDGNGNKRPDRATSVNKIDGVVAGLMATGRAVAGENVPVQCVYSDRGIFVVGRR